MRQEKQQERTETDRSVLGQELEIIVMRVNRIGLDRLAAKLAAVK